MTSTWSPVRTSAGRPRRCRRSGSSIESRATGARIVPLLDEPIDPLDGYTARAAIFGRTPDSLLGAIDVGRIGAVVTAWAEGSRR